MFNQSFKGQITVEVITLALYYASEMSSMIHVLPAYESALEDIDRLYPRLKFHQNIVTDEQYHTCAEMSENSDDVLAKYYYSHEAKWRKANATIFIDTGAGT